MEIWVKRGKRTPSGGRELLVTAVREDDHEAFTLDLTPRQFAAAVALPWVRNRIAREACEEGARSPVRYGFASTDEIMRAKVRGLGGLHLALAAVAVFATGCVGGGMVAGGLEREAVESPSSSDPEYVRPSSRPVETWSRGEVIDWMLSARRERHERSAALFERARDERIREAIPKAIKESRWSDNPSRPDSQAARRLLESYTETEIEQAARDFNSRSHSFNRVREKRIEEGQ